MPITPPLSLPLSTPAVGALQGTLAITAANGLARLQQISPPSIGDTTITIQFASGSLIPVTSGDVVISSAPSGQCGRQPWRRGSEDYSGHGKRTVGTINVPPSMQGLAQQPDGSMEVRASGIAGQTYLISGLPATGRCLANISTNVTDANGIIVFLDRERDEPYEPLLRS